MLAPQRVDLPLQHPDGHLAVAAVAVRPVGARELVGHAGDAEHLALEVDAAEGPRLRRIRLAGVAVVQLQDHVRAAAAEGRHPRVGEDGLYARRVAHVEDGNVPHPVGSRLDARRPDEVRLPARLRADAVQRLFLQQEGGRLPPDVDDQLAPAVVGLRQHAVVEPDHGPRDHPRGHQHRRQQAAQVHPARLERGDLVLRHHAGEGVEHRHQHRHGEGERHRGGKRQREELQHHPQRQPLPGQVRQAPGERVDEDDARQSEERKKKRAQVRPDQVPREDSHSACVGSLPGAGAAGSIRGA